MTDIDIKRNNVIIMTTFIIGLIAIFLAIGYIGIPFIGESPDTITANTAVDILETDDSIVLTLDDDVEMERIEILVDDTDYQWDQNNQITLDKTEINDDIIINSYSDGNLYDTYSYNPDEESISINSDSQTYIDNLEYEFELSASSSNVNEFESIEWRIDDNLVQRDISTIEQSFNANNTHTISAKVELNNTNYYTEKDIRVIEPDEVVIEAQSDKKEVEVLEELQFNVTEISDQNVESFNWYLDDDSNKQGEEIGHWFQESGEYNVTVTGISEDTNREGSDSVNITVLEQEDDVETYQLNVNVFDRHTSERITDANVEINNAISKSTGEDGSSAQFRIQENEYDITVEKDGYDSVTETEYVDNNSVVDIRLSEISDSDEEDLSDEEELSNEDSEQDFNTEIEPDSPTDEDITEPEGFELILENMDGDGSSDSPYVITTISELQAIEAEPTASYILGNDINAAQTQLWNYVGDIEDERLGNNNKSEYETIHNSIVENTEEIRIDGDVISNSQYTISYNTGEIIFSDELINNNNYSEEDTVYIDYESDEYNGFRPIDSDNFAPVIDGNGHEISNIHINRPYENNVGIFTEIDGGSIHNLSISGQYVKGNNYVGGITGELNRGIINNVSIGGSIIGNTYVGGLSGYMSDSSISNNRNLISINGVENVGGITGYASSGTQIEKSAVQTPQNKKIHGVKNVGGLIGNSFSADIDTSYSLANIDGQENSGGLIGIQRIESSINTSYTTSNIIGEKSNDTIGTVIGLNTGSTNNIYEELNNNYNSFGDDSDVIDDDSIYTLEPEQMQSSNALNNMVLFDFKNTWEVTEEYPKIQSNNLINIESNSDTLNIHSNDEVINVGDTISDVPEYENTIQEDITVNIIESEQKLHSFDIEGYNTEENEEGDETINTNSVIPESENHLYGEFATLEGYNFDEENMEIDVFYTALDENQEHMEVNTSIFVVEILNDEEIKPTVEINDEIKTGDVTQFELINGEYTLNIDDDKYYAETQNIEINEDNKIVEIMLQELPEVDLTVDTSENSDITVNGETKTGTSVTFDNLIKGDYEIDVNPDRLEGSNTEIISIGDEDKTISYNFESPLLTINILDDESGDPVTSTIDITSEDIEDKTRIDSDITYVDIPELGDGEDITYDIDVTAEGYDSQSESITISENEDEELTVQLIEE